MDSPIGEINPALVAVLAVWLLMLLAAIFSLWQSKYSLICLFTVPVGCLALVACALLFSEVAQLTDLALAQEVANTFHPTKLRATDILLSGLLFLVAFGFSKITEKLEQLELEITEVPPQQQGR
ncbi:hypothetical protein DIPPA_21616 [Diplonema papillatum]|nr:hypothetical protein DIPPA_21616 [Diplonema papillatum]